MNRLSDTDGTKIRRQYLNIFVFVMLAMSLLTVTPVLVMNTLWGDSGTRLNSWSEIFTHIIAVALVLMLPFILVSVVNRFLFGKVVCVLNDRGISYRKGSAIREIRWEDVRGLEYGIRIFPFFATSEHPWCYARITGNKPDASIDQAPFMLLKKVKKYTDAKITFEKTGLKMVALALAIPFCVSVILGLLLIL